MNLKNKVVVITGSSAGLGKELAKFFIKQKAEVIINSHRKSDVQKAAKELGSDFFVADVTDKKQMVALAKYGIKQYGGIDIWINNAGIWMKHAPVEKLNLRKVEQIMDINFFGTLNGCQAILPHFYKKRKGTIMNTISISAIEGHAFSAGYAASKWAQRGFTQSLRAEAKKHRVKVLAVYPEKMDTAIFGKAKVGNRKKFIRPEDAAKKIINNLKKEKPNQELVILK